MEVQNSKDWAKVYKACNFIEKGVCEYADERVYLSEETLFRCLPTIKGRPVIIDHKTGITPENMNDYAVGYVTGFNMQSACDCDFVIFEDEGKAVIAEGYSVSCAYKPKAFGPGGTWHNVPYDREITDLEYTHLALVQNPRYEDAKVYENAKDGDDKGRWITIKGTHVFIKDGQSVEDAMKEHGFGKSSKPSSTGEKKKSDFKFKTSSEYKSKKHPEGIVFDLVGEEDLIKGFESASKGQTISKELEDKLSKEMQKYSNLPGWSDKFEQMWDEIDDYHDQWKDAQKQLSTEKKKESYHRQKEDEDLLDRHGEIQKQKEELLKKLKATDDIKEGDKILAQIDELNKQQDELGRQRLDIAKEAYTKSKDLQGKYTKEDADFDVEQLPKDIKAAQSLGYESIEDIAEFLGLDEDEVRGVLDDSESDISFDDEGFEKFLEEEKGKKSHEQAKAKVAREKLEQQKDRLDKMPSTQSKEQQKARNAAKEILDKNIKDKEKHNSTEEQLKEEDMKVDEFFNKMGEMIEEKLNACKNKMNEGDAEEVDDDDKFELDGEIYSKKELVNAFKEKKNAEESEEKSDNESEEKSNEEEEEKQNSGDEFFNAMEKRMQQQIEASDKIEVYSQQKGLEKGKAIYGG